MVESAFGAELRRLRHAAGMSLNDLAARIHYSKGYLSKVETGLAQVNPTFASLCDDALGSGGALLAVVPRNRRRPGRPRSHPIRIAGLPADVPHFTGRIAQQERLRAALCEDDPARSGVCVVDGMAGVGKTALAVHVAHQVANWFPDGAIFLDLRGFRPDADAVSSMAALDRLLRLLGIPGDQIPTDPDDRAAFYRGCVRDRRLLIVLDNAGSAAQVRPLLPAARTSRVVVTSRNRLLALDDAEHVSLDVLSVPEAAELFAAVAPDDRDNSGGRGGSADRDSCDNQENSGDRGGFDGAGTAEVVRRCGRLPLAVRIAAARYRANPGLSLGELARRLSDQSAVLSELDDGERSVTAALTLSYRGLPTDQARLFTLLAVHPGDQWDAPAAAALAELPLAESTRLSERLVDAHLLGRPAVDRYDFHDLLRLFARQTATQHLATEVRTAALRRLVEAELRALHTAQLLLNPLRYLPELTYPQPPIAPREFADAAAAREWLRVEWPNLVALCRVAGELGWDARCWQFAYLLRDFFFLSKLWDPWLCTHEWALRSARACGDGWAEAATLNNLGVLHLERGEVEPATAYCQQALAGYTALGDERGRVNSLANLGWAHHYGGEPDLARRDLNVALRFYRRVRAERNIAITLRGIALAETELGEYADAIEHATEALGVITTIEATTPNAGLGHDAAMAFNCIAWAHFRAGHHEPAAAAYHSAIARAEAAASAYEVARAETGLGNIAAAQDRPEDAQRHWDRAAEHHPEGDLIIAGEARLRRATRPAGV